MKFKSINPYNGKELKTYSEHTLSELDATLSQSEKAFASWRDTPLSRRCQLIAKAANELRKNKNEYAEMMTLEMGKPITESRAEVEKCAWVCDYYAENAEGFLADEIIKTDASQSFVRHNPIGCVFAIMPWNFPYYQVARFAGPNLVLGNTILLKHAEQCPESALAIATMMAEAGFPEGAYTNLFASHDQIADIIADPCVQGVSVTGSERAGAAVAQIAGRNLKKVVLEMGGSDVLLVLDTSRQHRPSVQRLQADRRA